MATQITQQLLHDNEFALNSNLYRNAIINGNFDIWQRGTSFTALAANSYAADRWAPSFNSEAVVDFLQSSDTPTIAESGVYSNYSLQVDVTTADTSISTTNHYGIQYKIEGYNIAGYGFGQTGAKKLTLSFWVKSTKTGTFCVSFRNSSSDRSYVAEYTVSSSDTWEKKTITITPDTTGTWLYDSGVGVTIRWELYSGTDWQTTADTWTAGNKLATSNQVNALDSTSNNFRLAQVQLNAGSVALPFQPKSFEAELRACQRYYFRVDNTSGVADLLGTAQMSSATLCLGFIPIMTPLRKNNPTLSYSGLAITDSSGSRISVSSATLNGQGTNGFRVDLTIASGGTAGNATLVLFQSGSSNYLALNAEL